MFDTKAATRTMETLNKVARAAAFVLVLAACAPSETISISLDPGDSKTVHTVAHCGFSTLEFGINGQGWSTQDLPQDSAGNPVEPAWEPAGKAGLYELEITLIDNETLSVTKRGSGATHIYKPNPNPPGCA